jgi:hypothetical protein
MKEAAARIKINKLLEAAGWRFFAKGKLPANTQLEPKVTIKIAELDAFGSDFEKTANGFIDFLLLDSRGFPLIVLEAKSEDKSPLVGKEQARKYARPRLYRWRHSRATHFGRQIRGRSHLVPGREIHRVQRFSYSGTLLWYQGSGSCKQKSVRMARLGGSLCPFLVA